MIEFAVYILLNNLDGTLTQKCMILKKKLKENYKEHLSGRDKNCYEIKLWKRAELSGGILQTVLLPF